MKLNKQLLVLGLLTAGLSVISFVSAQTVCVVGGTGCITTTTVNVTLNPGNLSIGSTGNFNFGSYTVSNTAQTVNGTFSSPFFVEDLRGSNSGYHTTIQMSGALQGSGSSSIPAANVSMRTTAVGNAGITTIAGSSNTNVVVNAGMSSFQTLNTPRRLIERVNGANFGLIGQYGVTPQLQLIIPAYQAIGTYSGTLIYTMFDSN